LKNITAYFKKRILHSSHRGGRAARHLEIVLLTAVQPCCENHRLTATMIKHCFLLLISALTLSAFEIPKAKTLYYQVANTATLQDSVEFLFSLHLRNR
jgi:hypothetical protein